jgi:hypothetical protein
MTSWRRPEAPSLVCGDMMKRIITEEERKEFLTFSKNASYQLLTSSSLIFNAFSSLGSILYLLVRQNYILH